MLLTASSIPADAPKLFYRLVELPQPPFAAGHVQQLIDQGTIHRSYNLSLNRNPTATTAIPHCLGGRGRPTKEAAAPLAASSTMPAAGDTDR